MKQKIKLGIILGVEFVAITVILILIFFSGKKSYKVTFDLNGGTLISGELEQTVSQGKSATPPVVAKDGCYLHSWSASFRQITRDIVIEAVWEWETSIGFDYVSKEDSNYCEIEGCFENLYGDVYVGAYHDEKKVLGVRDNAFRNRDGITYIHMLDGILSIGDNAFSECDSLVAVELPGTLKKLGVEAFKDCTKLEKVVFPDELEVIPARTFAGCVSLKEIVIPASVKLIEEGAFDGCISLEKITFETHDVVEVDEDEKTETVVGTEGLVVLEGGIFTDCDALTEVVLPATVQIIAERAFDSEGLTVYVTVSEEEKPEGFAENWHGASKVEWSYVLPDPEPEEQESQKGGRK